MTERRRAICGALISVNVEISPHIAEFSRQKTIL